MLSRRVPLMKISGHIERAFLRGLASLPEAQLRRLAGPRVVSPDGAVLDVEAQLLLGIVERAGRKELRELGVTGAREQMEQTMEVVDFRGGAARVEARSIPVPRGRVPIRIYHPRSRCAPRPVLVYFHGGGWVVGSVSAYDGLCRALARDADAVVVSVDYGLAPEHPFPVAVDDAVAATRWVVAHCSTFDGDPRAVAVGGDSAGGNLAAVVAQETLGDAVRPVFQLLVYPATDLTRSQPSHRLFAEGYLLTTVSIDFYLEQYITEAQKRDPRASPLFAPASRLRGLPPALVLTAGFDPLRDEGRAYAEKMRGAGVQVEYRCVGSIHGFFSFGGVFAHARRVVLESARALGAALRRG
jgi:acetyl esterase